MVAHFAGLVNQTNVSRRLTFRDREAKPAMSVLHTLRTILMRELAAMGEMLKLDLRIFFQTFLIVFLILIVLYFGYSSLFH